MTTNQAKCDKSGFTLIELLAVLALMAILMAIAAGGFNDWGRGASMRTSVMDITTTINGARQFAITHRVQTTLAWNNTNTFVNGPTNRGFYVVYTNTGPSGYNSAGNVIGTTNYLPDGLLFTNLGAAAQPIADINFTGDKIVFGLDGSLSGTTMYRYFDLFERERGTNGAFRRIRVAPVTGRPKVLPEILNDPALGLQYQDYSL